MRSEGSGEKNEMDKKKEHGARQNEPRVLHEIKAELQNVQIVKNPVCVELARQAGETNGYDRSIELSRALDVRGSLSRSQRKINNSTAPKYRKLL